MTICAECKHAKVFGFDPANWCCQASFEKIDPVSGRMRYSLCSEVNNGNCALFERYVPPEPLKGWLGL